MSFLGLLVGAVIAAAALVVWFRWHRSITGGDGFELPPKRVRERDEDGSLEDFVAAYRRGEVSLKEEKAAAPAVVASAIPKAALIGAAGRLEPALPAKRDPFLSGPTKLVYYICKSGLRDHHLFANVRLEALGTGKVEIALAASEISLLVCNAAMSIVAAIDVVGEPAATDTAKVEYLRALGIRYLRLSAKSLPRPDEIRALLYRM